VKRSIRILVSAVAAVSAGWLALGILLGLPSFWWLIATAILIVAALAGSFSSAAFTGLAIPALTAITIASIPLDLWQKASVLFLLVPLGSLWAGAITSAYLSRSRRAIVWRLVAVSCVLLAAGFGVDRVFTNQIKVHSYEMQWTTGGGGPIDGPSQKGGERRVVIYRHDSGAVCYDAIYSTELAEYVRNLDKPRLHVEYEGFYDFGKERGYNVRSIEGKLITKGAHPVLHTADGEGGVLEGLDSRGGCER